MEPNFKTLSDENHVFSISEASEKPYDRSDQTYTTHDFLKTLENYLSSNVFRHSFEQWTKTGVKCNLLKIGSSGWVVGKIRIRFTLEFVPDQPED